MINAQQVKTPCHRDLAVTSNRPQKIELNHLTIFDQKAHTYVFALLLFAYDIMMVGKYVYLQYSVYYVHIIVYIYQ